MAESVTPVTPLTPGTPPPGTPTQVAHPWRSVLRVVVAWAVGFAVAWLARTLGIDLGSMSAAMVDSITVGVWGLVTAAVQWLLTRKKVDEILSGTPLSTGVETEGPKHLA